MPAAICPTWTSFCCAMRCEPWRSSACAISCPMTTAIAFWFSAIGISPVYTAIFPPGRQKAFASSDWMTLTSHWKFW